MNRSQIQRDSRTIPVMTLSLKSKNALASLLTDAHRRGAKVLITNSGAPNIRELYQDSGFRVEPLFARRSVSCKGDTRGVAHDVIAILL